VSDSVSAERIGRNNATFRAANERLGEVAAVQDRGPDEWLPFLCECADPACTQVIRVALREYRSVRSDPRRFVVCPGHDAIASGFVRVVEEHTGYVVTEKVGRAGEVAERLAESGADE
jgi:hypothetical protein